MRHHVGCGRVIEWKGTYTRPERARSAYGSWQISTRSFYDQGTEDVFTRRRSKAARRMCTEQLWRVAQRKLDQLNAVVSLGPLRVPPGNRLEALRGGRQGQHSIRINDQYRICFVRTDEGPERVEITDYH
jgi:proteic killer suppression protein